MQKVYGLRESKKQGDYYEIAENSETARPNADIVVIGGGGGLAAALAAAEQGAKVTLLEKRKVLGGNTALARGLLAGESPVQRRMRIDARNEDLFKTAMAYAHWKINPEIVRTFLNRSGDTVRWLEEKGVRFQDVPNFYYNQVPRLYHVPEGYGAGLVKALAVRGVGSWGSAYSAKPPQ